MNHPPRLVLLGLSVLVASASAALGRGGKVEVVGPSSLPLGVRTELRVTLEVGQDGSSGDITLNQTDTANRLHFFDAAEATDAKTSIDVPASQAATGEGVSVWVEGHTVSGTSQDTTIEPVYSPAQVTEDKKVTVVGIDEVRWECDGEEEPQEGPALVVHGEEVVLRAIPDPEGATLDAANIRWTLISGGENAPEELGEGTLTHAFDADDYGDPGAYEIEAAIVTGVGENEQKHSPQTITVHVVRVVVTLDEVEFRGDAETEGDDIVVVFLNDGFEEGNEDEQGDPLPDHQPDHVEGHRIAGDDPPIVSGSARLEGLDGASGSFEGTWTLTYGDKVMIWQPDGEDFVLVGSEEESDTVAADEEFEFLIEGISVSAETDDVTIQATFALDGDCETEAKAEGTLTVVGISGVEWEEIDSELTANEHPAEGANIGTRIFPCKQTPDDETARNTVRVVATVVPASEEIAEAVTVKGGVRFRSFDVNDPSTDDEPVDDSGPAGNDNRGIPKEGQFDPEDNPNPAPVVFADGSATAGVVFTVTMQPGDNFRIAAAFSGDNLEDKLDVLQVDEPEQDHFVHEKDDVPGFETAMTELLTVWRRLHIEIDSMEAVHQEGDQSNVVTGHITEVIPDDIGGGVVTAETVVLNVDLTNLPSGPDNSKNLSGEGEEFGRGRFERGRITIGNATTENLTGNGDNFVRNWVIGIDIPFAITHPQAAAVDGWVVGFNAAQGSFVLEVENGELTEDHAGGTLDVAGVQMEIDAADPGQSQVVVVEVVEIPFELVDDDDHELLPVENPDLSVLAAAMAEAYIEVADDTDGVSTHNNEVDFVLNVDFADMEAHFDRGSVGADDFWVVYHLTSYQGPVTEDRDPNDELATVGAALAEDDNFVVAAGGSGSQVFAEVVREGQVAAQGSLFGIVLAHEIGHQMGLSHWDVSTINDPTGIPPGTPIPANLMLRSVHNLSDEDARFVPGHLHLLRSRVHSPGDAP